MIGGLEEKLGEINFQVPQSTNSWFRRGSQTQYEPQLRNDGVKLISLSPRSTMQITIRSREKRWK